MVKVKVGELVEKVLINHDVTRGNDHALLAYVLNEMGFLMTGQQAEIFRSVSFESITRARRKYQQQGKFLPSDPVLRERRLKSLRVQQVIPSTDASKVVDLISEKPPKEATSGQHSKR